MILPAGVTKGSGLLEALGELGLSQHNTIGVGDAENDHSLLEVCEIGVAVANAVDAIRAHADVDASLCPTVQGWPTCFGDRFLPGAPTSIRAAGRSHWASTTAARR